MFFEFEDEKFLIFCRSGKQEKTDNTHVCHVEMAK